MIELAGQVEGNLKIQSCVLAVILFNTYCDAIAQYPIKPIRLIVPTSPGGAGDYVGRYMGQMLGAALGKAVIVDNRPGAAGNIGVELAAKAVPDGHTIVIPITSFPINPSLYSKMPFDTVKDLAPIILVEWGALILVINPSLPATSVDQLVTLAKAKPGTLNFANTGNGTTAHLAGELFKKSAGVNIVSVSFKGGGPAIVSLIAGHVQIYFSTIPAAVEQVKAGRLRALAVTSTRRVPELSEIPTVIEAGIPGFDVVWWQGLFAPTGTPRSVIDLLNRESLKILKLPETAEKFSAYGLMPGGGTPEELGIFLKAEIAKWGALVRETGIKTD